MAERFPLLTERQIRRYWSNAFNDTSDRSAAEVMARAVEYNVRAPLLAEIERLTAELECERMRLVACGVVAMSDTPDSAAKARDMHKDYKSAACDDVARRVDECMTLRAALAARKEPANG